MAGGVKCLVIQLPHTVYLVWRLKRKGLRNVTFSSLCPRCSPFAAGSRMAAALARCWTLAGAGILVAGFVCGLSRCNKGRFVSTMHAARYLPNQIPLAGGSHYVIMHRQTASSALMSTTTFTHSACLHTVPEDTIGVRSRDHGCHSRLLRRLVTCLLLVSVCRVISPPQSA